ncbi:MAG: hypothetical protein BGO67_06495 [Alphaproteobacteria bacterium 41-28]|nr:MAG: hypothetical protein BGO67_06495 [Alphaproteobacteria bacterium 41-28]
MKNQASLIALICMIASLSQPAWSMEDPKEAGSGKRNREDFSKISSPPGPNKRNRTEPSPEEPSTQPTPKIELTNTSASLMDIELTDKSRSLMDIPQEARQFIFSFLAASTNDKIAPELLALSSVSRQIRAEITARAFLRSCLTEAAPNMWRGDDDDWLVQPLFLFHLFKKKNISGDLRDLGDKCFLFKSPLSNSNSRLLAYRLALVAQREVYLADKDKKLMRRKISAAMHSLASELLNEDEPERGFSDLRKDAAFLLIYFMQPDKVDPVEARLQAVKTSFVNVNSEEMHQVPRHLLRIMSIKDKSLSLSMNVKVRIFEELARRKDAVGQFNAAISYQRFTFENENFQTKKDLIETWLGGAAQQGLPEAQLELRFYTGAGIDVSWLEKVAQQGLSAAQYALGLCYARGNGVNQNGVQALFWWRKAAEHGHDLAQYNLARAYEQGKSIDQDITQAVYWYQRGIRKRGIDVRPEFFNALGTLYETGIGVPQDLSEARSLYELADEDDSNASRNLETFGTGAPRLKTDLITDPYTYNKNFILTSECWPVGQL